MSKLVSKFVRVATEGPTIDGRSITGDQIEQMASNYDQGKYGARVWLEHFRSLFPDGLFKALGDVPALKVETNADGKKVLLAQISPTPDLIEMNKRRQKVFTSIEMDTNFADTGQAYMVGLAVTDTPASTGTEMLTFSVKNASDFSDSEKITKNCFSSYIESDLFTFEEEQENEEKPTLFNRVSALLGKNKTQTDSRFHDIDKAVTVIAQSQDEAQTQLAQANAQIAELSDQVEELTSTLKETTDALKNNPNSEYTPRPQDDGGETEELAEC